MPSANLELVRSIYVPWARGDFSSTEWAHPEIELVVADGPTPGRCTGVANMGKLWGETLSPWAEFGTHPEGFRELDGDRVLVPTHNTGRGKSSGLELGDLRTTGANLFHLSDGMVTKLVLYFDRERAFAELGLDEHGDPREAGPG